ncbi:MAG: pantoate--beta-alanine ligase [Gemmatimonadetes bacterium]|nr:pantoate--beta-alanine ligase [Gemmatimonadota bacterium]
MRAWSRAVRRGGRRIGFVPTMGFLHQAHLRLVADAARHSDAVVMSIFVNPLQFGPGEDLERYPRDLARDRALAAAGGVACLFVPSDQAMYRRPAAIRVTPGPLARHLCGPRRPGHFEGVLTVVAKLFHIVEPDVAVFGRKDVQQARIIQRMVDDLDLPVEILVSPTVREADGLALSSRNAYLSRAERSTALALSRGLEEGHRRYRSGTRSAAEIIAAVRRVADGAPGLSLEYVEAVDPENLDPVADVGADTILALAARVGGGGGGTRLIDNVVLGQGLSGDERVGSRDEQERGKRG